MLNPKQTTTTVTATQRRPFPATRALHLWHLLSLDAPTVATLWTWFVARTVSIHLPISFLAVWMLYAADRLLDSRPLFTDPLHTQGLEPRHLFHHRHANAFLTASFFVSLALASLLHRLPARALELDAILGILLLAWFLLIHAGPDSSSRHRLPKELAVGIFFPAAVFIPTLARQPSSPLLPYALLFAAICTLNCLCIYAWEHPAPTRTAHWTTRLATRHLTLLALAVASCGLITVILARTSPSQLVALAATFSAATLLALHQVRHRLTPLTLRAAADLALLTPILLLPWLSR